MGLTFSISVSSRKLFQLKIKFTVLLENDLELSKFLLVSL